MSGTGRFVPLRGCLPACGAVTGFAGHPRDPRTSSPGRWCNGLRPTWNRLRRQPSGRVVSRSEGSPPSCTATGTHRWMSRSRVWGYCWSGPGVQRWRIRADTMKSVPGSSTPAAWRGPSFCMLSRTCRRSQDGGRHLGQLKPPRGCHNEAGRYRSTRRRDHNRNRYS